MSTQGPRPSAGALPGGGRLTTEPGEGDGHSLLIHGQSGVMAIADQPFQFDPDLAGRAGLEADPVDVLLGVALGQRFPARPVRRFRRAYDVRAAARHEVGPVRPSVAGQSLKTYLPPLTFPAAVP